MVRLRKATVADVPQMIDLMRPHITAERLLPRSHRDVAERLRDYVLATVDGRVIGLASVSLVDTHLAEVGALTTDESCADHSAEGLLLDAVLDEVRSMGVERVFVMTDDGSAFTSRGFMETSLEALPEKRDRQCLRCPRLPRCRQAAFELHLGHSGVAEAK